MSESAGPRFPGLSPAEVEASRRLHGHNVLTPPPRDPWWVQFLEKFDDPVIRILIIAAVLQIGVGLAKGEYIEGVAIVIAILLATTIAFVNEFRANREFDILNRVNDDVPIKVIRGGQFATVPRRDVVVGDVVLVEAGDELPCDGDLLESVSFLVDESRLTGESVPVSKYVPDDARPAKEGAAYPPNRLMRGTLAADGHATLRATAVGDASEIGKAAIAAGEETHDESPLQEQLEKLSQWIGVVGLGVASLTFFALTIHSVMVGTLALSGGQWYVTAALFAALLVALVRAWLPIVYDAFVLTGVVADKPEWLEGGGVRGWLTALAAGAGLFAITSAVGYGLGWVPGPDGVWLPTKAGGTLLNYFMIAVVIIVVAVPEGLAMSVTLSLAYSMRKMTAQNTLVRKMHACETIGAATVICSDKTGTLTRNQMRVAEVRFPATGNAVGGLVNEAIAVNTTAHLAPEAGGPKPIGNPTEGALLLWLDGHGVNYLTARSALTVTNQLTFSTERKYMATAATDPGRRAVLHVKGAPELVMARCERALTANGVEPWTAEMAAATSAELAAFQARGMRTIALAYRDGIDPRGDIELQLVGLTWLGFVAIADPVRDDVPAAVAACRRAGIGVKIVTGDTPATAREIGRQIGLTTGDEPGTELTGPEFAALTDTDAAKAVGPLKILARARPLDKLRLVRLLQAGREVVAVTGDGTNDAPALNHAKVGLAMGQTGTAVAKEAADIVLLDDSFGSIVNAVKWGRGLYENIQRFIVFQLTINVCALGVALLGPFVGVDFPLTVMQMLWVNLIMDTFAALALATEPPRDVVLNRPPRSPEAFIVTPGMARIIFGTGFAFLAVLMGMLTILPGLHDDASPSHMWSLTVFFSTFVLLQFWNLFNARCLRSNDSAFTGLTRNPAFFAIAAVILLGQIVLVQYGGSVFRTVPLAASEWAVIIAVTSVVFWIGEVVRYRARMNDKS